MVVVIDASALLAVLFNEPEATLIRKICVGVELSAPDCIDFEIGNALSAQIKRGQFSTDDALELYNRSRTIPVKKYSVDMLRVLKIAGRYTIYAYDAYYLAVCEQQRLPLITLDKRLEEAAKDIGIRILPLC